MKAVGIVLAGGSNNRMGQLSKNRAVAAMPVAGSYRCIDFVLSNMSNSHIQKVAVLTQYNSRSLNEHLNSSKWWDFGRKQGGLFVLTPFITEESNSWYLGTADSIYQNLDFLRKCHEPYVIITSGDCIYKMDFDKILDYHIKKKADITVAVKDIEAETEDLHRFGVVRMAEDGRIVNFEEKPLVAQTNTVSIGVYVIRRRLLIELIQKAHEEKRNDFVQDILVRYKDVKKIFGYKHEGYWENIATIDSYYHANMDFLKRDVRDYFFHDYPNVYSKIEDLPPAKFNPGSKIKNSLVSSGCIVNGEVQDSILFKKVYVGNNCVIKNSIILNDVYIGDNTVIENCIVESRDTIRANASYIGEDGKIQIVVEKSDRYIL
ncbi:glucose-1-phosphate adenylyltransferase subunit GlgD [Frisingicoccus sp.]|uniref:glucose-1-phosphate adenylyltransferase subunit GlgD n=1 Tax=Frisingicoccus sp. TaxID=1918627 RepID=UPI0025BF49DA|nr:glucose-1-phosphate adenylyltransferase subunit GlgD [Frisingicoccus sp.]MDY4834568.1 glucose-1-phosphate adenylyltransferase subunit GlgD [Frisingicoccus sp.]MDY4921953.1 glucose-1-phosphate adenylyltransferase subunit GlgD [Frisingicoccus sp.]MDY5956149.1 glucose-1-phosphate adenylyltransferase subunit GlgD [Frisingicoccus sp.]